MPANTIIRLRKGTSTDWSNTNPVLASGEPGYDVSSNILKIGNGSSTWSQLNNHNHTTSNITDFGSSFSGLLPSTIVYTSGSQTIGGVKTFSSGINITGLSSVSSFNNTGSLFFNNSTTNFISFNASGVGAPTTNFGPRSSGTKIILSPSPASVTADYAIGIETDAVWHSIPSNNQSFKWYGGSNSVATLTGNGVLTVQGFTSRINVDNLRLDDNVLSTDANNTSLILEPNGYGALRRSSGGDPRGQYAVDWQAVRSTGTMVAAGVCSAILGGRDNTVLGENSSVIGGSNNTILGKVCSIVGGQLNVANAHNSFIPGGRGAKTTQYGEFAHAAGYFATPGDSQHSVMVLKTSTTNATANIPLTMYGSSLNVPATTSWTFTIKVSAYNNTDRESGWWIIRGGVKRNDSSSVTIVGSTIIESGVDSSLNTASANIAIDNTALAIVVTGVDGKNIRWVAVADICQVSWNTLIQ